MQNATHSEHVFKPLNELTLMDDYMFSAVMRNKSNLKPLLECILNVEIADITFVEPQKTEKEGYLSHGIVLDLYVRDTKGRIYNVEIQTSSRKNLPKRMRYYQSVIDVNILAPGVDYQNLKDSNVIFICNYDPFGKNRFLYVFENKCLDDCDLSLGDGALKVVANTKGEIGEINDRLKEVLLYLNEGKATGDYSRHLDDEVRNVKASEERRHEYMVMMIREMEIREEGKNEGREEGRAEGRAEGRVEGRAEGRVEGRAEGRVEGKILGTIETMRDDGKDDASIVSRIMNKYHLTREEAENFLQPAPVASI